MEKKIVYYPIFDNSFELTSHYRRACWYLPSNNNRLTKVILLKENDCSVDNGLIDYMAEKTVSTDHIHVMSKENFEEEFENADVILVWRDFDKLNLEQFPNKKFVNVTTDDIESVEYGKYCSVIWQYYKTKEERTEILLESKQRFEKLAEQIKDEKYNAACVFGTGPSLRKSWNYDFSNCMCVVCNSIVQNRELLEHINPWFVCAGDAVSHLGVSKYAEVFREDLIEYLLSSRAYYVTTAKFGYLLTEQCPEISHKIILIDQTLEKQNKSLLDIFALPKLDSTFNIHMLPLANTFSDLIFINGCDGKIPNANNEDFWAHDESAQYLELVETGHKCSPTFDQRRQLTTYARYNNSVEDSMEIGTREYGKKYYTLEQSYITGLKGKKIPNFESPLRNDKGQIILSKLFDENNISKCNYKTKKKLKIAICSTMPKNMYSGGRYHAWIMAEALVEAGHDVYFIANNRPVFEKDFKRFEYHEKIQLIITEGKHFNVLLSTTKKLDFVIIVPNQDKDEIFYNDCEMLAKRKKAKMVLLNFESENWFNHYLTTKKDERVWKNWRNIASKGALVLCSAKESVKWAEEYYTDNEDTKFDYWYPAINSIIADTIKVKKENRIVAFVRLSDAHKGGRDILDIISPDMKGYVLVIISGSLDIDAAFLKKFKNACDECQVAYEIKYKVSDYDKFMELKRAKYLLFPSYFEGYGYPPVEAQYCNTKCFAYDLPVLREISGDNIIYCKYGDSNDMRKKLGEQIRASECEYDLITNILSKADFNNRVKEIDSVFQRHLK